MSTTQQRRRRMPGLALAESALLLLAAVTSGSTATSTAHDLSGGTRPCSAEGAAAALPFCDPSLSVDDRIEDLLGRLTLEEKVTLIVNDAGAVESQGLPVYNWWSEALHGVGYSPGVKFEEPTTSATSFPQVITTSHSFNPRLVHAIGGAIATEARVFNNHGGHSGLTFWAPNINIFRDPRWGRGQETPGEDPFWSGEYAAAFVRGMQEGEDARYLKVSACCKHFAAYSVENLYNGTQRHNFDAHVTAQDMADTYLPAFHACVAKGRASGIMCSYNSVNGVPSCADGDLLNGLARGEWRFDGYVTSDCNAIADIWAHHNYTATPEETCGVAIRAGTDLDCSTFYEEHALAAVTSGQLAVSDIDVALRHLFKVQFRLGLFDPSEGQVYAQYGLEKLNSAEHQALALEAARQGMVLLKNEQRALPLSLSPFDEDEEQQHEESESVAVERRLRRGRERGGLVSSGRRRRGDGVVVIGPHGDATQALLGNYYGNPPFIVSPLAGIQQFTDAVTFAPGCAGINASDPTLLDEAVAAASQADTAAVVLVLGIDKSIEDEGLDRRSLALPAPQLELARAVLDAIAHTHQQAAESPTVVLVLIAGGAVDLSPFKHDARVAAILFAGYPGQAGGQAIAEVLFGAVSPSGRLSQTFYPSGFTSAIEEGDMRMRPDPESGYPGRTYRFYTGPAPVYEFGHGLSYARLMVVPDTCSSEEGDGEGAGQVLRLTTAHVDDDPEQPVIARVCVQVMSVNMVTQTARHVLLAFLSPPSAGGEEGRPLKTLRAFGSMTLERNELVSVEMAFTEADFSLADAEGQVRLVTGKWTLSIEDVQITIDV